MARGTGTKAAVVAASLAAALIATAGAPAIAIAEPTESASPTPGAGKPMSASTAATRATRAYGAYDEESASLNGTTVPIVTVEDTANGPKVLAHQVGSPAQARAVATDAARGHDLVGVGTDNIVQPVGNPTDPEFGSQWALNPQKTSYLNAWNTSKGAGITVAVVDTGVAANHPDLAGRVLAGHEFLNGGWIDRDVNQMIDDCGHGTHVAGTIAAIPNNGKGGSGAAPAVKILPVRVLAAANQCGGWSSDVARGIVWAANRGARVINLSLGGPGPDSALANAVKYARSKGAVVVAAAGNNHSKCTPYKNKTVYPGASTGSIGVGAVDSNFQHACFSNQGSYVDIAAPGVQIYSTVTVPPNPYAYGYSKWSGTSMATPHVAAAAALVLAYRPVCSPDQVESRLETTAVRLPRYTAGDTKLYGNGLVDPAQALKVLKGLPSNKC